MTSLEEKRLVKEVIATALWNCLLGWLEPVESPRCRWICNIGIDPIYRCELEHGHTDPHKYGGGKYSWPEED